MTDWLVQNAWVAVAVPLAVAVLCAVLGRFLGRSVAALSAFAPLTVLGVGVTALRSVLEQGAKSGGAAITWLPVSRGELSVGFVVDGLAGVMLTVVGVVALMVVVFSIGYMAEDSGKPRYFALLAAFCGAMSIVVIADNLVTLLVGWELVGACSYLLIGFWYRKPSAANAALKAFLVTHVGDAGILLGIAYLWTKTGSLTVLGSSGAVSAEVATIAALLILLGAIGKSAQFPLHFWLPDAMEGPTPVSALIHAATMVAAGVYLLARLEWLFAASPVAQAVVLAVGAFTAFTAATIAVAQSDIKKVLAYSTISQLGFMFAALGAGAWGAAMFHLVTHAAFKALLFLGAGSVIHGTGTQDLGEMGGLWKKMPLTTATWGLGALALAGVPPMAGFFSKDAVVASVLHASPVAGVALLAASLLTAFYITRATRLAFFGTQRGEFHAHEGGLVMTLPLVVLAAGAAGLGFLHEPVAELLGVRAEPLEVAVAAVAVMLAAVGIAAAWLLYARDPQADTTFETRAGGLWRTLRAGYGYDAAVMSAIVRPTLSAAQGAYRVFDRAWIDAFVEGVGSVTGRVGGRLNGLQNGDTQWYAALLGAGVVVLLAVTMWLGR